MKGDTYTGQTTNRDTSTTRLILKAVIELVMLLPLLVVLLFVTSGRFDWVMAWVVLGVYLVGPFTASLVVILRNPGLARERAEVPQGAEAWDKTIVYLSNVLVYVVMPLFAGLDKRFAWSPGVHLWVQLIALAVVVLGWGLYIWAMMSNPFFSAVVRMQEDRGHTVVSDGPYRYVRHPGYVGMFAAFLASPLTLGSLWALIPAASVAVLLAVRTVFEERALLERLDGYEEYAQRVRYRLLPGVW